jgi:arsenate reductase-like glutaredoxin family protein
LEDNGVSVNERASASQKLGREDAKDLLAKAKTLHVAKGSKWRSFSAEELRADEAVDAMLGPTGNLRAPTIRVGEALLVGFHEEPYGKVFDTAAN